ncbi:MAG: DUF4149 domain-containing protein [Neisseria sp.]|nr:DUF4149 domain-containing protein [Neisseria sp.]
MNRIAALLIGTWFGMQISAYLIAPVLFDRLNSSQAGGIAGILFSINAYSGLAVWLFSFFLIRHEHGHFFYRNSQRFDSLLILIQMASLAFTQFVVTPVISAHKNGVEHFLFHLSRSFSFWHGVSQSIYLFSTVLGLVLVLRLLKFNIK